MNYLLRGSRMNHSLRLISIISLSLYTSDRLGPTTHFCYAVDCNLLIIRALIIEKAKGGEGEKVKEEKDRRRQMR